MTVDGLPLGLEIKEAQHAVRLALDAALAPLGVTMTQWGILRAAALRPRASGVELARMAFASPQAVNLTVMRLEQAGLLTRQPAPDDRRTLETHLTARGQEVLAACDEAYRAVDARMVADLSDDETRHLSQLLARCTAALLRDLPTP